jgi:hypothetical protein
MRMIERPPSTKVHVNRYRHGALDRVAMTGRLLVSAIRSTSAHEVIRRAGMRIDSAGIELSGFPRSRVHSIGCTVRNRPVRWLGRAVPIAAAAS